MELRASWKVLVRRWPLALIPFLVVLALGLATYHRPAPAYNVGIRFTAGQPPVAGSGADYEDDRYYPWLTSEYIVNGLADWVKSGAFATAVSEELAAEGIDVPAGAIRGTVASDNVRSVLLLSMTFGNREQLAAMIDAASRVLQTRNMEAFPFLGEPAVVVPLDEPVINQIPAGLRATLDLPLRLVLAAGAGLGLAFLVNYLDPTVQSRADLEAAGLQVLVEIPRHKKRRAPRPESE
jgi:capsular polysaccharide biosynthesis protein